jgi:hypothetical protein
MISKNKPNGKEFPSQIRLEKIASYQPKGNTFEIIPEQINDDSRLDIRLDPFDAEHNSSGPANPSRSDRMSGNLS